MLASVFVMDIYSEQSSILYTEVHGSGLSLHTFILFWAGNNGLNFNSSWCQPGLSIVNETSQPLVTGNTGDMAACLTLYIFFLLALFQIYFQSSKCTAQMFAQMTKYCGWKCSLSPIERTSDRNPELCSKCCFTLSVDKQYPLKMNPF